MSDKIRVLIVDDHSLIQQGLQAVLADEPDINIVGHATNGRDAVALARELVPDVVLMDVRMPGMDGVEATRQIKAEVPQAKVVILSVYQDEEYLFNAVEAGAVSYVLKDVTPEELIRAIRLASKGKSLIDPGLTARILTKFRKLSSSSGHAHKDPAGAHVRLTPREREVLSLLAQGKSNKEIARTLGIAEKTVKNHMSNIFEKFQVNDRTQALIYALRHCIVQL
ncbi:MAG: response regulator [Armatimonadota bacterium]